MGQLLPASGAKDLVEFLILGIPMSFFLYPEKLGELVVHLAVGGEVESAMKLMDSLFSFDVDRSREETIRLWRPKPWFSKYDYGKILEEIVPKLVPVCGMHSLYTLCNKLNHAMELVIENKEHDDGMVVGKGDISAEVTRGNRDVREPLVRAIYSAITELVLLNKESVHEIVGVISKFEYVVFQRIELQILADLNDVPEELFINKLYDPTLLWNLPTINEYLKLAQGKFQSLSEEKQKKWIELVLEGPGREEEFDSPEDYRRLKEACIKERLSAVIDSVPDELRSLAPEVFGEVSPKSDFRQFKVSTSWVGPQSPKSKEELRQMTVDEIIKFIESWTPPEGIMVASPAGVGRHLADIIYESPEVFSTEADKFKGLEPTYVSAVLDGLRTALKNKLSIAWDPVIDLCYWVVFKADSDLNLPGTTIEPLERETSWRHTRRLVADVLSLGFHASLCTIPSSQRQQVWEIVHELAKDPYPNREEEDGHIVGEIDPGSIALNFTRPVATDAVFDYAWWVVSIVEEEAGKNLDQRKELIPEVLSFIEDEFFNLNVNTVGARYVLGQRFPALCAFDIKLAEKLVPLIFPLDGPEDFKPAWDGYILRSKWYSTVFPLLLDRYAAAIDLLPGRDTDKHPNYEPEGHLVGHLMTANWAGAISITSEDQLLERFYNIADDDLRRTAIYFVGTSLRNHEGEIQADRLQRIRDFWNWRITACEKDSSLAGELSAFSHWFLSDKYETDWLIAQMKRILELTDKVDVEHEVIEKLQDLAQDYPHDVVTCLRTILSGMKEGYSVTYFRAQIKQVLRVALSSGSSDAVAAATDLQGYLISKGLFIFENLDDDSEGEE